MQPRPSSPTRSRFLSASLRAGIGPLVGLVLAAALVWHNGALPDDPEPAAPGATDAAEALWKASYSRRFPGCVATVLWPVGDTAAAVVVRGLDGEVQRVPLNRQGLTTRQPALVRGRTIGVCRER